MSSARLLGSLTRSRMLRVGAGALLGGGTLAALRDTAPRADADGTEDTEHVIAQLRRQADKARKRAQERVRLGEDEVLGMTPKLWLEALDEEHRYGSVLYRYWQRWETSRTRWMFFDWLDRGRGSLIDLPVCPRRMLEESAVLYLELDQLKAMCEVRIEKGLLVWCADGLPVTLPTPHDADGHEETPREAAFWELIEDQLAVTRERERLLHEAREAVAEAIRTSRDPTPEALKELTAPLVHQGLLRQLRDPQWTQRGIAMPTIQDQESYDEMWERYKLPGIAKFRPRDQGPAYLLPEELLPGLDWSDVVAALDHEEGRGMKNGPLPTADERKHPAKPGKGGIFAIDQFGAFHAAQKVNGVLHHSSLTSGHACRFAGAITVKDGRLLKVTPHSGHYVPTQAEYDALISNWQQEGLDMSKAVLGDLVKEKRKKRPDPAEGPYV